VEYTFGDRPLRMITWLDGFGMVTNMTYDTGPFDDADEAILVEPTTPPHPTTQKEPPYFLR
jgi:hypothetical protein